MLLLILFLTALSSRPLSAFIDRGQCFKTRQSGQLRLHHQPEGDHLHELSLRDYQARRIASTGLSGLLALVGTTFSPLSANAVKGAFEMDAEFYIRDLLQGNNGGSNKVKRKPVFGSPRTLDSAVATDLVQAVYGQISKYSGIPVKDVAGKVTNAVPTYIPKFTKYVPIKNRNLSDQYYFDITLYVSYLVAAELIPDSVSRIPLRKGVGSAVFNVLKDRNLIQLPPLSSGKGTVTGTSMVTTTGSASSSASEAAEKMSSLSEGVSSILQAFTSSGILSSYEYDAEDLADYNFAKASFSDGLPVSFQITLKNPATILGFLEQTAANSFFHPEIIATTIASYARTLGFKAHYEDYLMDNFFLYDQEENEVTAQDVILEVEVGLQSSNIPDF